MPNLLKLASRMGMSKPTLIYISSKFLVRR